MGIPSGSSLIPLQPLQRIALGAAGPTFADGKLFSENFGEALDAKSFAGVVTGEDKADAAGFGVIAGMQSRLTGDDNLAAAVDGRIKEFAGAAAGDGDASDGHLQIANDM